MQQLIEILESLQSRWLDNVELETSSEELLDLAPESEPSIELPTGKPKKARLSLAA